MKFRVKLWCVDGYGYGLFWKHWVRVRDFDSDMDGFFHFALVNNLLYCGKSNCSKFRGFFFFVTFFWVPMVISEKPSVSSKNCRWHFLKNHITSSYFYQNFHFFKFSTCTLFFLSRVSYFELPLVIYHISKLRTCGPSLVGSYYYVCLGNHLA